ncbi:MAG: YceD family protein [Streptococcaceae bacterium]|jgi:uncharacterized protein|nr:YceD family protein [Streptococcaceae bacterium]
MKWSLQELNKKKDIGVPIQVELDLKESLLKRDAEILDISKISVTGNISVGRSEYIMSYNMQYTITLPSSRSLTPVELPISLMVDEVFQTKEAFEENKDEEGVDEIIVIEGQTISLDESVEDNILLAIPLKVLTPEEESSTDLPTGTFWKVVSEADYEVSADEEDDTTIDPRLAKLQELLNNSDES